MLIGTFVIAVMASAIGFVWWPLAIIFIPVLIWLFAFFRDPHRLIPTDEDTMVSPADGKVSDITEIEHDALLGGPAIRVGIFLSVFNVHINRSPCDAKVFRRRLNTKRASSSMPWIIRGRRMKTNRTRFCSANPSRESRSRL